MNKLPIEINSEMKIFGISLTVMLFGAAGMFFGTQTQTMVYAPLQTVWVIFNVSVWLFMGLPSPVNRKKRMFSSLYLYITRDDKTYLSIPMPRGIEEITPLEEDYELNEEIRSSVEDDI